MSQLPPLPPFATPLGYSDPRARPGILTAVGIISLVIGCLGVVINCAGLLQAIMFRSMGAIAVATSNTPAATAPALINPNALSPAKQQIVLSTMTEVGQLSPARARMLDQLLSQTGTQLFPFDESRVTPQSVRTVMSESGRLPDTDGQAGSNYFVLSTGRIELSDEQASFRPTRGERISVSITESAQGGTPPTVTPATVPVAIPPAFTGMGGVAVYMGIDAVIGIALAVFLLVCGVFVLRDLPRGRSWHIAWAWLKLPLAVLGGIISWMQSTMLLGSVGGIGSASQVNTQIVSIAMAIGTVVQVAIICAYPVAVLIVMRTQRVKEFYSGVLK
jgi:hypothetical protein